jgi:hypothetical protein
MGRPELYEPGESLVPGDAEPSSTVPGVGARSGSEIWLRRGAVALAALLVAAIAYLVISGLGGGSSSSGAPQAVNASKLSDLAGDSGHPVYWAGPRPSDVYEWTELSDGRIYVRYLTGGAGAGDPRPRFLTIGTYPVGNGPRAISRADKYPGNRTVKISGGATALVNSNSRSVYLAYPGSQYQIEVFDPDQSKALRLVSTGKIQPVP